MSYNGVGLPTARGTGTSGHIQKNVSSFNTSSWARQGAYERRQKQTQTAAKREAQFTARNLADRKIDEGILEHERKRGIESKCVELRYTLEQERDEQKEKGVEKTLSDDQIEERVEELRRQLKREDSRRGSQHGRFERRRSVSERGESFADKKKHRDDSLRSHDVHNLVSAKARENDIMKEAFEASKRERGRRKGGRDRSLSPIRRRDTSEERGSRYSDEEDRPRSKPTRRYSRGENNDRFSRIRSSHSDRNTDENRADTDMYQRGYGSREYNDRKPRNYRDSHSQRHPSQYQNDGILNYDDDGKVDASDKPKAEWNSSSPDRFRQQPFENRRNREEHRSYERPSKHTTQKRATDESNIPVKLPESLPKPPMSSKPRDVEGKKHVEERERKDKDEIKPVSSLPQKPE